MEVTRSSPEERDEIIKELKKFKKKHAKDSPEAISRLKEVALSGGNIMEELMDKGSVLVHCYAGVERSPLICIAWLMKNKGLDLDDSLRYLMEVNPGTNPLPQQLNLLRDFFG